MKKYTREKISKALTGRKLSKLHVINIFKSRKLKALKIRQRYLDEILKNKKKCFLDHHFTTDNGAHKHVKKLWFLYYKKKFPKNMGALHKCDNGFCINIFHIFPGTQKDNMKDMVNKDRQAKGESQGSAKLIKSEVLKIRLLYASGKYTYDELANKFSVAQVTINRIISRKTWKHI